MEGKKESKNEKDKKEKTNHTTTIVGCCYKLRKMLLIKAEQ